MANTIEIVITAIDKTKTAIGGITGSLSKLGTSMIIAGASLTAGITVPLANASKQWVLDASNLVESQNAVNVVFGESAGVIQNFAETASTAIGMSTSEFNQMSIVIGALLQNVGMEESAVADETIKLGLRAADLASVFNTDVSQALTAIEAGLRGQTRPLTNFGIKLTAADIQARALAMGLAETSKELTIEDKALAALNLIYEQSNHVVGDFQKTADEFANSQRILGAELTNLSASLGAELIPLLKELIPIVKTAMEWFNGLDPSVRKVIVTVGLLVAGVGPLILIIGSTITILTALATALGVPVLAIVAVIAAVAALVAALIAFWPQISQWAQNVMAKFNEIKTNVVKAVTDAYNGIKSQVTAWFNAGKDLIMGLVNGVKAAASRLIDSVKGVVSDAIQGAKNLLGISSPSKVFQEIGSNMMAGWAKGIQMNASPQFAIQGAAAGMVSSAIPSGRSSGGAVTINLSYSPVVSLADRYEAETKLVPYIEAALRKIR